MGSDKDPENWVERLLTSIPRPVLYTLVLILLVSSGMNMIRISNAGADIMVQTIKGVCQ